jgi:hypothetical protein
MLKKNLINLEKVLIVLFLEQNLFPSLEEAGLPNVVSKEHYQTILDNYLFQEIHELELINHEIQKIHEGLRNSDLENISSEQIKLLDATRICGHDFHMPALGGYVGIIQREGLELTSHVFFQKTVEMLAEFELLTNVLEYGVLNGKNSVLKSVPIENIGRLISKDETLEVDVDDKLKYLSRASLPNDIVFIVYQFVKNSQKGRFGVSETYLGLDSDRAVFRDNGTGILDKNGRPFDSSNIGDIFKGYSSRTSGGGNGLSLVRFLSELGGHDIQVTSRTENLALDYSTRSNLGRTIDPNGETGTEFRVVYKKLIS